MIKNVNVNNENLKLYENIRHIFVLFGSKENLLMHDPEADVNTEVDVFNSIASKLSRRSENIFNKIKG